MMPPLTVRTVQQQGQGSAASPSSCPTQELTPEESPLKVSVASRGTKSYEIYGHSIFQLLTEASLREPSLFFLLQCHLYELKLLLVLWLPLRGTDHLVAR